MPRPRPTLFEVRKSANNQWRIVGFVNGVRKQYWFKSEKDAKQAANDRNAEVIAHGTQVSLDPLNRMRALNAIDGWRRTIRQLTMPLISTSDT
jgi:hypothetical protein